MAHNAYYGILPWKHTAVRGGATSAAQSLGTAFTVFIFLRASGIDMPRETKDLFFWKSVVQGLSEHWDRASDLPVTHKL